MVVAAVALALLFLVPFIPARLAISPDPSLTALHYPGGDTSGWGIMTDPSGNYLFYTLSDSPCDETTCWTTTAMNLTSYQQLKNDPYSTGIQDNAKCTSFVQGAVILVTCPQARCAQSHGFGGMSCSPITTSTPPVGNGSESVAYLFFHQGTVYYGGKYLWG